MQTIILCGGKGTRIRDVADAIPKPMFPIGNRPVLWHIMKIYEAHGFDDFVLALGFKSWAIKEFFLNYQAMLTDFRLEMGATSRVGFLSAHAERWRVTFAETGIETPTGNRVKQAAKYVDGPDFMVTYGDGVGDVDVKALVDFHRSHGKLATVTAVSPPGRFGDLAMEGTKVRAFNEKPADGGGSINGGFLVFKREFLDLIPDEPTALEAIPLMRAAELGEMHAFPHRGFWRPMDTPREHEELNALWNADRAPWRVWGDR